MIAVGKITKSGGHCYDPMGVQDCAYWEHREADKDHVVTYSRCRLFGNTSKNASRALVCCDKIYGKDYEGRA
jgi:hypothetical protein